VKNMSEMVKCPPEPATSMPAKSGFVYTHYWIKYLFRKLFNIAKPSSITL